LAAICPAGRLPFPFVSPFRWAGVLLLWTRRFDLRPLPGRCKAVSKGERVRAIAIPDLEAAIRALHLNRGKKLQDDVEDSEKGFSPPGRGEGGDGQI
jgi:hypothetical protein